MNLSEQITTVIDALIEGHREGHGIDAYRCEQYAAELCECCERARILENQIKGQEAPITELDILS